MRPLLPPKPPPGRDGDLERLAATAWDLLVVGGGASGVAVAFEAAARGLSVALVEQDDLASGTSSRSSRLIHGGLRYLAQGDLALVREGLVERRRLLDAAPGLVRSVPFLYPVFRGDPDGMAKVALGLSLYDLLSLGGGLGRHRRWSAARFRREMPALRAQGLRGGFLYRDAAAHDARLVLAVAIAAADAGALIVPRCRTVRFVPAASGVELEIADRIGARSVTVGARSVVLACGPWAELLPATASIRTARGAHLAVPAGRLPLAAHVALRSPDDGRLAFAMPCGAYSVLGTTDVDDPCQPEAVRATREDVGYLLRLARHAFPLARLQREDVTGVWAGLRPLLAEPGETDPDALSRRHRVLEIAPGVFVLQGGKLTTHRRMAEDTLVEMSIAPRRQPVTARPLLAGSLEQGAATLRSAGAKEADIAPLAELYGARLERLANRVTRAVGGPAAIEERILRCQVELAVEEEWAWSLDDLLLRRLLPGPLNLRLAVILAPWAADVLAAMLAWSARERETHLRSFVDGVEEELRAAGLGEGAAIEQPD